MILGVSRKLKGRRGDTPRPPCEVSRAPDPALKCIDRACHSHIGGTVTRLLMKFVTAMRQVGEGEERVGCSDYPLLQRCDRRLRGEQKSRTELESKMKGIRSASFSSLLF